MESHLDVLYEPEFFFIALNWFVFFPFLISELSEQVNEKWSEINLVREKEQNWDKENQGK